MARDVFIPSVRGGGGDPVGWNAERLAVARDRIGTVNRWLGSDLNDANVISTGTAPAALDLTRSAGVYTMPGAAGDATFTLGRAATQIMVATPKAESWYVASRVMYSEIFSNAGGHYTVPIGLNQGANAIWIAGRGQTSTTVFQFITFDPAEHLTSLGASATLGASTCPLDAFFPISMYFNVVTGTLSVEFSDTLVLATTDLDDIASNAAVVVAVNNAEACPQKIDGMFWAGVGPTS